MQDKRLPSNRCIFCNKTLDEIGGVRIVFSTFIGVGLSNSLVSNEKGDIPYRSVKIYDDKEVYAFFRGSKDRWTPELIEKARNEFSRGFHPWFCQVCSGFKCRVCGSPLNYAMGVDTIDSQGDISHMAIFPFTPWCTNPKCGEYKPRKNAAT